MVEDVQLSMVTCFAWKKLYFSDDFDTHAKIDQLVPSFDNHPSPQIYCV